MLLFAAAHSYIPTVMLMFLDEVMENRVLPKMSIPKMSTSQNVNSQNVNS